MCAYYCGVPGVVACACVRVITRCYAVSTVHVVITIAIVSSVRPSRSRQMHVSRFSRSCSNTRGCCCAVWQRGRFEERRGKGKEAASSPAVDDSSNDRTEYATTKEEKEELNRLVARAASLFLCSSCASEHDLRNLPPIFFAQFSLPVSLSFAFAFLYQFISPIWPFCQNENNSEVSSCDSGTCIDRDIIMRLYRSRVISITTFCRTSKKRYRLRIRWLWTC